MSTPHPYRRTLFYGSMLLGVGLLGAFDGIVFHQLLQWHSVVMHTSRHGQILSDGLFHAFAVAALVGGALLLWRAGRYGRIGSERRLLLAGILMGGGWFNVVEGLLNHHILQLHHVKQGDPNELMYDLAFLMWGGLMLLYGAYLQQTADSGKKSSVRA